MEYRRNSNTPTDNWLTLQNGTFIYNRTGNINISTITDFIIPATAGLTLNTPSNVYISNNNASETLYLNGISESWVVEGMSSLVQAEIQVQWQI